MGSLISVVGNSGVGKTTFVTNLCQDGDYFPGFEQHERRPFQELFMHYKHKYALANQIDYLLFRAQQEIDIRKNDRPGVQDGGLDQDYFIFTKLFFKNKYLSKDEFSLCERTYQFVREVLPPPDLIVWLKAPVDLIAERYNRRDRRLDITQIEDMEVIEQLLESWLGGSSAKSVYVIDAEREDENYSQGVQAVSELIRSADPSQHHRGN